VNVDSEAHTYSSEREANEEGGGEKGLKKM
jgi:hypothetical protein